MIYCYNSLMQPIIAQIKEKLNIVDVVGSYITLKPAGKYFKANCPFHQEKTPSYVVSPEIDRWHCFGACHEGGDIFNFVMKWENVSFSESLRILAERAGVPITQDAQKSGFQDESARLREIIFQINELSSKYFAYILHETRTGAQARAYLESRELPKGIIQRVGIGYAPEGWSNLRDYLRKKHFADTDMLQTGLFVQGDRGIYDRFRGRVMFPIHNARGKIVGFAGRLLKENPSEKDGGKYVNTPETLVYHKRESLYGLYFSKDAIRGQDQAIVVEGEFDMLLPYAHGISNIVAIKGSAFTDEQLETLKRYTKRLVLALDTDKAGFEALKKSTLDAQKYGFELYVAVIPDGKDPDEAARSNIVDLKKSFAHPIPVYDYMLDTLFKSVDAQDPFTKQTFIESSLPYIDIIENPIVKTHYIQKLGSMVQTSESNVKDLLADYSRSRKARGRKPSIAYSEGLPVDIKRTEVLQRHILATVLSMDGSAETLKDIFQELSPKDFEDASYGKLYELFASHIEEGREKAGFVNSLESHIRALYEELFLYASMLPIEQHKGLIHQVLEYKKHILAKRLQTLLEAEESLDDTAMKAVSDELARVEKKLSTV